MGCLSSFPSPTKWVDDPLFSKRGMTGGTTAFITSTILFSKSGER